MKEAAEEDIYFAERDLELIEALRKKTLTKVAECGNGDTREAKELEKRFESLAEKNKSRPHRLARSLRNLLDEIGEVCTRRRP